MRCLRAGGLRATDLRRLLTGSQPRSSNTTAGVVRFKAMLVSSPTDDNGCFFSLFLLLFLGCPAVSGDVQKRNVWQ